MLERNFSIFPSINKIGKGKMIKVLPGQVQRSCNPAVQAVDICPDRLLTFWNFIISGGGPGEEDIKKRCRKM